MRRWWWAAVWLWSLWAALVGASAHAAATPVGPARSAATDVTPSDGCRPHILAVQAARVRPAHRPAQPRPTDGWVTVSLPDSWERRWPGFSGSTWYRIDFELPCAAAPDAVGLGVDGVSMAGRVFVNDELLWQDRSLTEPLSRSWNQPRWWVLPTSALRSGTNSIWVQAVGIDVLRPGLGVVRLGAVEEVSREHAHSHFRQRTIYIFSAGLSAAVGCLFGVVWCLRRSERAFGWYALMSGAWVAYLGTAMVTESLPVLDTVGWARVNIAIFVVYVLGFCQFTWRFSGQSLPRVERTLYTVAVLGIALVLLAPHAMLSEAFAAVWVGFVLVFFANCVHFQFVAWRPRVGGRDRQLMLLAVCWLVFLVMGVHDLLVVLKVWHARESISSLSAPLTTVCMSVLLGSRLVESMRRIERFALELEVRVVEARQELAQALDREHAQAIANAKLQERAQVAHDLHDGLGASLVRSMAYVELAAEPLPNQRVLSLFKAMRDDLRQVIDHGSSAGATVPETPVQWMAPLRHRFTRILDELGTVSEWDVAPRWSPGPSAQPHPTALQCLLLTRLVEEALSNVIKHSNARRVRVRCGPTPQGSFEVVVHDDGVGFDVQAVQAAGLSVGMRSMLERAQRMGGSFSVTSSAAGSQVRVVLPAAAAAASEVPPRVERPASRGWEQEVLQ